jgi:fatty-acyl-CoA synthase
MVEPAETLWQRIGAVARDRGGKDALVCVDDDGVERRLTYSELLEKARGLSESFAAIGMRRGDRLALMATNRVEWVITYLAAARLGIVLVPLNTFFKPAEIEYALRQSRVRHVVVLDEFRKISFERVLSAMCPNWASATAGNLYDPTLPEVRSVVLMSRSERDESTISESYYSFARLLDAGAGISSTSVDRVAAEVLPSDLAMIKYTSGSTGFPKGVMLTQGGIIANALSHTARLGVADGDERWFSPMPFFHSGGSIWGMMTTLTRGSTLIFTEAFDPLLALQLLERERCTAFFGVPTMLRDMITLMRERVYDLGELRYAAIGDPSLAASFRELVPSLRTTFNSFGLTECYGCASVTSPSDSEERQATNCGRFLDNLEYRVVEPGTNRDVRPGEAGEVLIRGNVMAGYWDLPEETAKAIDADGWLHSEDLISVDADGYITYVGRIKAMLKVGGENVAAEEVENVILGHPAVHECVVVGVPDPRRDQVGLAYIGLEPGHDVSPDELHDWCSARLARFKVPVYYEFVPSIMRIANGKPDRPAMQRLADEFEPPHKASSAAQ